MAQSPHEQLAEATAFLMDRSAFRPSVGIVLGSGLAGLASEIGGGDRFTFGEIPHMPRPTVAGHPGRLIIGHFAGRVVAVLQGRVHYYEGYSLWHVTLPVRIMYALGVRTLIATNAAGGLDSSLHPGDLMLIEDHINLPGLAGHNPLRGLDDSFGPLFVDMAVAYDPQLRALATSVAARLGLPIRFGTYVMVAGPNYETPAELGLLRALGGDAVGMSTAPEVVVARQMGMKVLGISCIANPAIASSGTSDRGERVGVSHQDVLLQVQSSGPMLAALIKGVVEALPPEVGE